jgi:hypothetical protein
MNADWHHFLTTQGAYFTDQQVSHFGDVVAELSATQTTDVLADLSHFSLLKVSGADAASFLQNLFSSDIRQITPQQAQRSSLNNAKGRVLATVLIWQADDGYFLQLPRSIAATIQKKLTMYVLRAKVGISDVSAEWVGFGVAGKTAAQALQTVYENVPNTELAAAQNLICLGENRWQIYTRAERAISDWARLNSALRPVGAPCWDGLTLRAGVPVILPATQEQFVLQMLNLDLLGAVSFKKGCYPGQEIVARMHYLGKLKQRMLLAHIASSSAPQAGDGLYSIDYEGQISGNIVNVSIAAQGGFDVLAVLHVSTLQKGSAVHWLSIAGEVLRILPLPYELGLDISPNE